MHDDVPGVPEVPEVPEVPDGTESESESPDTPREEQRPNPEVAQPPDDTPEMPAPEAPQPEEPAPLPASTSADSPQPRPPIESRAGEGKPLARPGGLPDGGPKTQRRGAVPAARSPRAISAGSAGHGRHELRGPVASGLSHCQQRPDGPCPAPGAARARFRARQAGARQRLPDTRA